MPKQPSKPIETVSDLLNYFSDKNPESPVQFRFKDQFDSCGDLEEIRNCYKVVITEDNCKNSSSLPLYIFYERGSEDFLE